MSDSRLYPPRPIVGVGGVVVAGGRVVLIRRRFEPLAGRWSIPGGTQEVGETLEEALVRELREETGLEIEAGPVLDVFDRITRDEHGRAKYHFVLIDYLCRTAASGAAGAPRPDSSARGPSLPTLSQPPPVTLATPPRAPRSPLPPLAPASDVSDAVWADPNDLARYDLTDRTEAVVQAGVARAREWLTARS